MSPPHYWVGSGRASCVRAFGALAYSSEHYLRYSICGKPDMGGGGVSNVIYF